MREGRKTPGWLADVPPFQRFTGDGPQLGHEVGLLPLCNALVRNFKVSLGKKNNNKKSHYSDGGRTARKQTLILLVV